MAIEKLDLTDRKILHELDLNARQPISIIAKNLRISRDVVGYRMKKFMDEKLLLSYYTIIDISKLGYAAHKNFIRFQNMTGEKEAEFIKFVKESPYVVYSASYDGRFDCVVSMWARNVEELAEHLEEMESRFGEYIAERQMATIVMGEYCVRDYLIGIRTNAKRKSFGSVPRPIKMDNINKSILLELGKDARISSVEIAQNLKLSADAIYLRIKKLQDSGIIQGYNIVPNEENYLFIHYKILISLHNLNQEKERKLHEYCRSQQNIWYFCTALGPWNFEIDLDAESQEQFRDILRDIKLNFSDIMKDYSIMTAYRTNKYNFCPGFSE